MATGQLGSRHSHIQGGLQYLHHIRMERTLVSCDFPLEESQLLSVSHDNLCELPSKWDVKFGRKYLAPEHPYWLPN